MRVASLGLPVRPAGEAPAGGEPRFLKGQLHAHTGASADSRTPPAEAAAWYADRAYDFVVFTDHNHVTQVPAPAGLLALPGVELTQNLRACDPAPGPEHACLLHVNALFVRPDAGRVDFDRPPSLRRVDLYGRALDRAVALGGIAQLNHPNFHFGADLDVILALARRGLALIEIENRAIDSANEGDAAHPSTEALWDAALSRGARVFGTASDDAHHYGDAREVTARGETAYVGDRGFVMVRARKTPEAIRAAVAAGDFYGTTGLLLDHLEMGPSAVRVEVRRDGGEPVTIEVIANGSVVERVVGRTLRFDPARAPRGYLRVRVTDARGRRAFTQPLFTGGPQAL